MRSNLSLDLGKLRGLFAGVDREFISALYPEFKVLVNDLNPNIYHPAGGKSTLNKLSRNVQEKTPQIARDIDCLSGLILPHSVKDRLRLGGAITNAGEEISRHILRIDEAIRRNLSTKLKYQNLGNTKEFHIDKNGEWTDPADFSGSQYV